MRRKTLLQKSKDFFTWPGLLLTLGIALGVITITIKAGDILSQVVAVAGAFSSGTTTLFLTPYDDTKIKVGEIERVDVNINTRTPVNALGVTIKFPTDLLEIVGFSKEKSFLNLWTEDTSIQEDDGQIHFSGGTTKSGGLIGTGTVLTILVKSKDTGHATLSFLNTEVFPSDGSGKVINDETRSLTFDIFNQEQNSKVVSEQPVNKISSGSIISGPEKPQPRTADVNTDGAINLVDVSIMFMRLVMPYDYHFDLNMDGAISVADVSVVIAQVR